MNINTLMKELYDSIKESGWLDKATKHFQEHPEIFKDCIYSKGMIATISMSISYQPESLSAVAYAKPNVFISVGTIDLDKRELYICDNGSIQSRTWINGEKVVEVKNRV